MPRSPILSETIIALFEELTAFPRTDEEIAGCLFKTFPRHGTLESFARNISNYRLKYNSGLLATQLDVPDRKVGRVIILPDKSRVELHPGAKGPVVKLAEIAVKNGAKTTKEWLKIRVKRLTPKPDGRKTRHSKTKEKV